MEKSERLLATKVLKELLDALLERTPETLEIDSLGLVPTLEPNFILKIVPGNTGAKFSRREDGRDTITLFVDKMVKPSQFRDVLLARKSSFIHEFIHLMDYKGIDPKDVQMAGSSDKEQFTHPSEVRAYVHQALFALEDEIENTPKAMLQRKFGSTAESFFKAAMRHFHPKLIQYSSPETKDAITKAIKDAYMEYSNPVSLMEFMFNSGKDRDWPVRQNPQVLMFAQGEKYEVEGNTHEGVSHAIKHTIEFFPAEVKSLLKSFAEVITPEKTVVKTTAGAVINDPSKVATYMDSDGVLLNTLDRINDKVKSGKPLVPVEKLGYKVALQMFELYNGLAEELMNKSFPVDDVENAEEIQRIVGRGKPIRFTAGYKGHLGHTYVFDFKRRALVSLRDSGEINTLFKIDPHKNVGSYISSLGPIQNPIVDAFLKN